MKSFFMSSSALVLIAAMTFVGCKKQEETINPVKEISPSVTIELQKSKETLRLHSQTLHIIDFKFFQTISSEIDKNLVVEQLTDPASSWFANGNLLVASSVIVSPLANFNFSSGAQDSLKQYIAQSIFIGNQVVQINWQFEETLFSTLCVVNDSSIIWDNILTHLIMLTPNLVWQFADTLRLVSGYDIPFSQSAQVFWLWGSLRGEMGYEMTIHCSSSNIVINTDVRDWAWIVGGSAQSESRVITNSGSYGKIQYALGIALPMASVTFNGDIFSVSVTGIGSNIVENGTHSLYP